MLNSQLNFSNFTSRRNVVCKEFQTKVKKIRCLQGRCPSLRILNITVHLWTQLLRFTKAPKHYGSQRERERERERLREREREGERERVANAMQGVPDVRSSGQLTCAGYGSDKRSNAEADRRSPHPHTCYTPAAAASRRSCCSSSSSCHDSHHTHAAAAWAAHAGALVYFQSALYHHHHHDFSIP